jgi:hypothetical protein
VRGSTWQFNDGGHWDRASDRNAVSSRGRQAVSGLLSAGCVSSSNSERLTCLLLRKSLCSSAAPRRRAQGRRSIGPYLPLTRLSPPHFITQFQQGRRGTSARLNLAVLRSSFPWRSDRGPAGIATWGFKLATVAEASRLYSPVDSRLYSPVDLLLAPSRLGTDTHAHVALMPNLKGISKQAICWRNTGRVGTGNRQWA